MDRKLSRCWRPIILMACGLGCLSPFARAQAPAPARRPPNILFIFSDDHAYQAIGAYNDPRKLIETPNIDRLARDGMRFDRCVVPNSICGPSRASVLTGKYSHINGFYNNTNSKFDGRKPRSPSCSRAPATRQRSSASGTSSPTRPASTNGTSCPARASTTTRR